MHAAFSFSIHLCYSEQYCNKQGYAVSLVCAALNSSACHVFEHFLRWSHSCFQPICSLFVHFFIPSLLPSMNLPFSLFIETTCLSQIVLFACDIFIETLSEEEKNIYLGKYKLVFQCQLCGGSVMVLPYFNKRTLFPPASSYLRRISSWQWWWFLCL